MATLASGADFRSLSRQPPPDPDIQATLSDFLTYTEHFPSHLTRALTLIEDRRVRVEQKIKSIHDNATLYSLLPTIKHDRPDPIKLRRDISYALEEAEKASRMALAEAVRLDETCTRESKRLDIVARKLKAQPLPPSRDPTPEPQPLTSPNMRRERGALSRVDESRAPRHSRHLEDKAATKLRGRKIMVPGEVLPPPDPNAPPESISDWTSMPGTPPPEEPPVVDRKGTPRARTRTPKPMKTERDRDRDRTRRRDRDRERNRKRNRDRDRDRNREGVIDGETEGDRDRRTPKPRTPRQPGQPGTNAHSSVAGISTSNALLALTAPPPDAVPGSRWLPWMKLTEWEMAKLRKRMKKNAIWVPSQTMVRRELKNLGRGLAGKEAAKAAAEANGDAFVDEHSEADPTKVVVSGDEADETAPAISSQVYMENEDADAELVNRGMRLNEAKKLKRQRMMEEMALQAQLAREQGVESGEARNASAATETQRKRRREGTPDELSLDPEIALPEARPMAAVTTKRLKISGPTLPAPSTIKVPLAPAGPSMRSRRAATPQEIKRPTLILKAGKAVSEEPPSRRSTLRRGSNVSLPNGSTLPSPVPAPPPTGRRSRRPAPGFLASANDDESTKVGVSKRKAAPRKKLAVAKQAGNGGGDAATAAGLDQAEDDVDPDEPRYCLCGDVSWGTMIACDNDDCEKEWFHLSCVGLSELPPRRTKWYCPDCRKKLRLGQATNGILGKAPGR